MWTKKLSAGVLRILTPLGPRYLKPSLTQRVYFCGHSAHFEKLPLQVLNRRQTEMIQTLWNEQRFVSVLYEEAAILELWKNVHRQNRKQRQAVPRFRCWRGICGRLRQRS